MRKIFYLSHLLGLVAMLCTAMVKAQPVPGIHQKKVPATQHPAFAKGIVLIKLSKTYEKLLASSRSDASRFGIGKLDSVLQKMKVRAVRQEFAMLFRAGVNEQSAANANRVLAARKRPPITAEILDRRHKEFGFHLWYRLQFDTTIYLKPVLQKLQSMKGIIEIAGAVSVPKAASFDDPFYPYQYSLNNTGQDGGTPGADIKADKAWTVTTGDPSVVVAVTDMGVKADHEDLAGNMWPGTGYNFVDNTSTLVAGDHGTHVAGIIAARSNNGVGTSGIAGGNGSAASGATIMSCMISNPDNLYIGNHSAAFIYAADNGAAINNNSWGAYSSSYYKEYIFEDAVRYFSKYGGGGAIKGGLTVWAAGNENIIVPMSNTTYDVANAIHVAATNNNDKKASYSNYGDFIDISAPGSSILSTVANPVNGYQYDYYSGTSMAAPAVSGVAALVASVAPGRFTADEVTGIVLSSADPIDSLNPGYEGKLGSGRVNAYKAVLKAQQVAAQPLLDTVSGTSVLRGCNGYTVSYTKNAAKNDVMIAVGLDRKFDLPHGHLYNVGDSIGKTARVVYKGPASSFILPQILKDSAVHYFKIWSVDGGNYSGGTVLRGDSSFNTVRDPSAAQGPGSVAISFGKVCPNSDVLVLVNSLPQFGKPEGLVNAGDAITGGGTVLYKGNAAGYKHSGLASGSYYYALYPFVGKEYGMGRYLGGYCFDVPGVPLPVKTSFEEPGVPQNFALFTPSQNGLGWETSSSGGGSTGTGYAYSNNFMNYLPRALNQVSYIQTAPINVSASDSVICRFAHALAAYDSTILMALGYDYNEYLDTLTLAVSADCGQTWQTAWKKWGYQLQTMPQNVPDRINTTPKSPADWRRIR